MMRTIVCGAANQTYNHLFSLFTQTFIVVLDYEF